MTGVADALRAALSSGRVDASEAVLEGRRHDYWAVSHVRDLRGDPAPRPACVVRPASVADVQATLKLANAHKTAVIPFGLGSGVVGGVIASPDAILLDMGAMNAVRFIDE